VAAREVDGLANRVVVDDDGPPAASITELQDGDLVNRSREHA
jgi:hypothetical protein